MGKVKGLSLNATTHYNQWNGINALNIAPDNAAAVALRGAYGLRVALMTSDLVLVGAVAKKANADVSGITSEKTLAKKTCSVAYGEITANALSFAMSMGLADLEMQMSNATENKIYKTKDANYVARCSNIDELLRAVIVANPVRAIAFFTDDELDAAALLAEAFEVTLGVYKAAVADVNAAKLKFRTTWFVTMKGHVKFMKNMLSGAITTAFPAYAKSFMELIKLVNAGKRDQGLLPEILDDATGLPFANIARFTPTNYPVTKKPKIGKSNGSGDLKLMKLRVGLWSIKYSVPGYEDQELIVKIDAKEVVKIVVRMKKL
jgi:hypothetical protein